MFAIFVQTYTGFHWYGNEKTIEDARRVSEDFRVRPDVEFVIVTPLAHFIDVDGERVAHDA